MLDVLTITLNPAIDQTVYIDNFTVDKVNRISKIQNDAGGKGINVASYLASSDLKVGVTGFLGANNMGIFEELFEKLFIENRFVLLNGETRTNVKVVDSKNKTVTDINQSGFHISDEKLNELEELLFSKKEANWYVFSGSLPNGLSKDIYKRWIIKAHDLGIKVALDASGESFTEALSANPEIIKPNNHELASFVSQSLNTKNDIVFHAKKLLDDGIQIVCVSMGENGALILKENEIFHAMPSEVEVKTTVGAGDAMLSGLILSQIKNFDTKKSIKLATAYSMSSVETVGPYLSSKEEIKNYFDNVTVTQVL